MSTVKKCVNRKFCTVPEDYPFKNGKCRPTSGKAADFSKLIKYIDDNIVGRNVTFLGPFGRRKGELTNYFFIRLKLVIDEVKVNNMKWKPIFWQVTVFGWQTE